MHTICDKRMSARHQKCCCLDPIILQLIASYLEDNCAPPNNQKNCYLQTNK